MTSNNLLPARVLEVEYFNKRRTTMNYTKPEVSTLGHAITAIEYVNNQKTSLPLVDPQINPTHGPAYDLDE